MRRVILMILIGCAFTAAAAPASAAYHLPGHMDCEPVSFSFTWNPQSWPPIQPSLWIRPECVLP